AGNSTSRAYNSLTALLKSGLITETNYEKVLKDFTTILKKIPQYAGNNAWNAYDSLKALLESGLITETNYEKVLKDFTTILKEIPQYTGITTGSAYNSLTALLESGLITETIQKEIFTILKEIPQYARNDTHNAYKSLLDVLKLMKRKNLVLDQDTLGIILDMIRQGDNDSGVTDTLNVIRDFILARVKDPAPEAVPGSSGSLSALLTPINTQKPLTVLSSNQTVFTDEQKKAILEEIEKYCGDYIQKAVEFLEKLEQSGVITPQNREAIFTILKEIPQHTRKYTYRAYDSLTALLKSGLITETNYEKILKDFTTILKKINQYAVDGTWWDAYYSLEALLGSKSGLITETNQKEVFAILKEIPQYAGEHIGDAYNSLTVLLKSGLITETNQKEVFAILKEIPQYAGVYANNAYDSLKALLKSGLITETNQKEVVAILKEIPQYARGYTPNAYNSFLDVLKLMKQKNLPLDQDSLNVILDMIRQGGNDSGVKDTLNAIRGFILARVKDPAPDTGSGFPGSLSALLDPINTQQVALTAASSSNQIVFTDEQKKVILREIEEYCGSYIQKAKESLRGLEQSGVITPQNRETIFTIIKEIPQHAGDDTRDVYNTLKYLLGSSLITETNQEEIFTILREIPQYAGENIWSAYNSLKALLKTGLITEANYEKVLKDFVAILKEIPQHAEEDIWRIYDSLKTLLGSGLITGANYEKVLKDFIAIFKEITQYAESDTWRSCDNLTALLKSGLITETNQKEIFAILKEIPQHANRDTHKAYDSLLDVLKLMKRKNLALDQDSLIVILNMIKQGDKDLGVTDTLNVIRDFILTRVKDPAPEAEPGSSGSLSTLLSPIPRQLPAMNIIKGALGSTRSGL
ncbi:MAG: hypothetical protein Q7O04_07915, partial [Candidatus Omnitrophota bacterium]|nr:hypothetical protein [Candidatus Omnitrophota bacterium]